jgi:copper chaperone CopZ
MDTTTTLRVGGMTCDNCVRHATTALLSVPGVRHASVDLASATAVIRTDGEPARDAIAAALADEGFELS